MRHRRPRPLPTACLSVMGYGLRCSVSVTILFWLCFWFRFRLGCIFGFGSGSVCCHVACCSLLAFVHDSLYFSFGYVFCPRYVGIMLLEVGLTGNSYGLQRVSHLQWSGPSNDKIKEKPSGVIRVIVSLHRNSTKSFKITFGVRKSSTLTLRNPRYKFEVPIIAFCSMTSVENYDVVDLQLLHTGCIQQRVAIDRSIL